VEGEQAFGVFRVAPDQRDFLFISSKLVDNVATEIECLWQGWVMGSADRFIAVHNVQPFVQESVPDLNQRRIVATAKAYLPANLFGKCAGI
jgi:hypothetical protein